MFISQMIGPVAQSARQDQHREHAAERRIAQARASARQGHAGVGSVSRESAMAAWLADLYLPPVGPVGRTRLHDSSCQAPRTRVARVSWASAATTWLRRVVNRLSGRPARTVASRSEMRLVRAAHEDGSY